MTARKYAYLFFLIYFGFVVLFFGILPLEIVLHENAHRVIATHTGYETEVSYHRNFLFAEGKTSITKEIPETIVTTLQFVYDENGKSEAEIHVNFIPEEVDMSVPLLVLASPFLMVHLPALAVMLIAMKYRKGITIVMCSGIFLWGGWHAFFDTISGINTDWVQISRQLEISKILIGGIGLGCFFLGTVIFFLAVARKAVQLFNFCSKEKLILPL